MPDQQQFTIYPAIDLRKGQVVRLEQGDPDRQITYNLDPGQVARSWLQAGAAWLHVVNLDGAFEEDSNPNLAALSHITQAAAEMDAEVQFGGGVRTLDQIRGALDMGVTRVILGTAAACHPEIIAQALDQFGPDSIGVGIDARNGVVKVRGWVASASISPLELGHQMAKLGVKTLVYTNIARDGVGTGVDVAATLELSQTTGLDVIASGGVATLEDVNQVKAAGLPGVIIGRALYDGRIDLSEALAC